MRRDERESCDRRDRSGDEGRQGKAERAGDHPEQSGRPIYRLHGRSTFTLEDGSVWKQSQQVSRNFPPVDSPPVIIVKGTAMLAGYRMYIAGGGNIRVSRVK
jgi:hypothetical protein